MIARMLHDNPAAGVALQDEAQERLKFGVFGPILRGLGGDMASTWFTNPEVHAEVQISS